VQVATFCPCGLLASHMIVFLDGDARVMPRVKTLWASPRDRGRTVAGRIAAGALNTVTTATNHDTYPAAARLRPTGTMAA